MAKVPYASVNLDVDTGVERVKLETQSDTPFRILVMGDFSGRGNRGEPPLDRLRPVLIDRDNFDEVMSRVRPELVVGSHGRGVTMRFRELDDFHPDRIYETYPLFEKFRSTRRMLLDPSTFAEAARTVKGWSDAAAQPAAPPPAPPPKTEPARPAPAQNVGSFVGGSLLDNILDASEATPAAPARRPDELQAFIKRAVAPHTAPKDDPQLPELIEQVDAATARAMRAILHHRDFQGLESAWRAMDWLVRGLETSPTLKVYLLDIGKTELSDAARELQRILVETAAAIRSAEPWSLVVGNFTFARTEADVRLLAELGPIMRAALSPFLAEADPAEPDSPQTAQRWDALRHSPDARLIGLALPRFLLRLPYGKNTDTVERFAFEEMPGEPVHHEYLWANPAFACAFLIALAFENDGWDMRPGTYQEIRGLPLHVYEAGGERLLKPCAEVLMTEKDAEWIMEQGFMALASIKNDDSVRLLRFQSIAEPLAALSGRWSA